MSGIRYRDGRIIPLHILVMKGYTMIKNKCVTCYSHPNNPNYLSEAEIVPSAYVNWSPSNDMEFKEVFEYFDMLKW